MLDNTIINQKKEVNNIHINESKDIAFEVEKTEEDNFFQTLEINGKNYKNLMGENPFITKEEKIPIKEEDWHFDQRAKALGYYRMNKEIPVKVIKITSIGNNKCLVELKIK